MTLVSLEARLDAVDPDKLGIEDSNTNCIKQYNRLEDKLGFLIGYTHEILLKVGKQNMIDLDSSGNFYFLVLLPLNRNLCCGIPTKNLLTNYTRIYPSDMSFIHLLHSDRVSNQDIKCSTPNIFAIYFAELCPLREALRLTKPSV
ncbi:unnamed protein product [Moneuplotes crassus]|uniref:Uncharacterized protein n=1 Tax=Euplotes crassus TaxID=5936 RepID=A0AAD1UAI9_EUPCR|nr:unnamed protein product [Moneuplotes crassus]